MILKGESSKLFPFNKHQTRPSSLPLPVNQRNANNQNNSNNKKEETTTTIAPSELQKFANTLVDGVIRTVSENRDDCFGKDTTEITVTDTDKHPQQLQKEQEGNEEELRQNESS